MNNRDINDIKIPLPKEVEKALDMLSAAGYEAYIVGGCVRDALRGVEPHDYDMTTSAEPQETEEVFAGFRLIETGIKHGTVTVLMDGEPLEITTFRTDGAYSDGRHPDSVSFTRSITEDLARRDFTVNAIAYSPTLGFADPFGGAADIERKVLKAVGEPRERFTEDALRIMRGLRFSAVLGYTIEPKTAQAMRDTVALLDRISGERIFVELKKLLCGDRAGDIIREYSDILANVLPPLAKMRGFEQRTPYHAYNVLEHTIRVVENVPQEPTLRLAALLHDTGKPDCATYDADGSGHFHGHPEVSAKHAESFFKRMKSDAETRDNVAELIKYHDFRFPPERPHVARMLGRIGETQLRRLFILKRADVLAQNPAPEYMARVEDIDRSVAVMEDIIREGDCCSVSQLAVKGGDLIAAGIKPGPGMGGILGALLEDVIDGRLPNEREALLTAAKKRAEE